MQIIDSKELNSLLSSFLIRTKRCDIYYHSLFVSLFNTGMRFGEFKNFRRWTVVNNESFDIPTEKGGNIRNVKFSELPAHTVDSFFSGHNNYDLINNSTACYYMKCLLESTTIRTKENTLKTHLFRHNRIRQMAAAGFTRDKIGSYIGEVDLKNVDWYINAVLYTF